MSLRAASTLVIFDGNPNLVLSDDGFCKLDGFDGIFFESDPFRLGFEVFIPPSTKANGSENRRTGFLGQANFFFEANQVRCVFWQTDASLQIHPKLFPFIPNLLRKILHPAANGGLNSPSPNGVTMAHQVYGIGKTRISGTFHF